MPISPRRLRTRSIIVAAASEVLARQGVTDLTVDDILEVSGVARATFYAHFTDKNDVVREVVAEMWRRAAELYLRFAAMPAADEASVRDWLEYALASWRKRHGELEALLRDMPVEITAASGRHLDEFAALLIDDGRHWRCSRSDAACRARLLIGQLERAMLDVARGAWTVTPDQLIANLTRMWMCALQAP